MRRSRVCCLCMLVVGLAASPRIATALSDLTVTALSGTPASLGVGKAFSLSSTVRASGGAAGRFVVSFYASTDATITTGDTLIGSRTVTSLASGGSTTATTTVTLPTTLAPGTYYVGALADSGSAVSESNESNNTRVDSTRVTAVAADLSVTAVSGAPASIAAGGSFTVTSTVTASSTGGNAGSFTVGVYLSADGTITTTDPLIGSRTVASLASGATSTGTTSVTVPAGIAAGTYTLGAIADAAQVVPDSNRANNTRAGSGTFVVLNPDLAVTSVSGAPGSIGVGDGFTVTDTVAASASGAAAPAFTVGYYLAPSGTALRSGILLGTRAVGALAAGASSTGTVALTVPAMSPGAYVFGAVADVGDAVSESEEGNNALTSGAVLVGAFSCQHPATPVDDGNPCTVDSCDPMTGVVHLPATVGASCSDGDACNGVETCDAAGLCKAGTPPALDDGNPCTVDACDPVGGVAHVPAASTVSCNDGNACSYADHCDGAGACTGTSITCVSDACATRSCNGTSACALSPAPAGTACDPGSGLAGRCDGAGACAGKPCVSDACVDRALDTSGRCVETNAPASRSCDDGNACTYADHCDGSGRCAGTAVSCVQAGPCQQVRCDGTPSCSVVLLPAGTRCSGGAVCGGQVCDGVSPNCQPIE